MAETPKTPTIGEVMFREHPIGRLPASRMVARIFVGVGVPIPGGMSVRVGPPRPGVIYPRVANRERPR